MKPLKTSVSHYLKALLLCCAAVACATSWADQSGTQDMTCKNWSLTSANVSGSVVHYTLKARCTLIQDALIDHSWNFHSNIQYNLDVQASYDSASHNAVENLSFKFDGGSNNGAGEGMGNNPDHISHSVAAGTYPQPIPGMQSAQCAHNPFPPGSQIPDAHCKNHQRQGLAGWVYLGGEPALTFGGYSVPYFLTYEHVDPQAAQGLENQAHNAQVLAVEQGVASPTVTAPTAMQKFYSQDLTIQGLIPAKYKKDGQNCCMIEIQKSDGQSGWLPPLPIAGKADIDTKGWVVPFSSFNAIGYGKYRVRISPLKYSPADAMAWSPYVEFGVWPKEVLEVPVIAKPLAGQLISGAIPMQITIPAAAKTAKVQCCELEFQSLQQGVWKTTQTMTDNRLGNTDGALDYDPQALNLGSGSARVHARFLKSVSGEPLAWSNWRDFGAPAPQVRAALPPATLPVMTATCGAAPKPPCKK